MEVDGGFSGAGKLGIGVGSLWWRWGRRWRSRWPNGGVLLFSGQASQARLSFTPGQTSQLEVDTNNDGLFETSIPSPL